MRKGNKLYLKRFNDDALIVSTQNADRIPFEIRRVYVITGIQLSSVRGRHAHKVTKQALFCIQGSLSVLVDNGKRKQKHTLHSSNIGLFIDSMVWHEMYDFSRNAIMLVFASDYFDSSDYIRDYQIFLKLVKHAV